MTNRKTEIIFLIIWILTGGSAAFAKDDKMPPLPGKPGYNRDELVKYLEKGDEQFDRNCDSLRYRLYGPTLQGARKILFGYIGPSELQDRVNSKISQCNVETIQINSPSNKNYQFDEQQDLFILITAKSVSDSYVVKLALQQQFALPKKPDFLVLATTYENTLDVPKNELKKGIDKVLDQFVIDFLKANQSKQKESLKK